jgi:hypothetical protein
LVNLALGSTSAYRNGWGENAISEDELIESAAIHNVVPLLHETVEAGEIDLSTGARNRIQAVSHATRAHARFFVDELIRILALLRERSIPVLCYKGPIIGQIAYSHPGLRPCGDLDLLVPPEEVSGARKVLLEDGYRSVPANKWRQSIEFFLKRQYHLSKGSFTFAVDVHTRPITSEHAFDVSTTTLLDRLHHVNIFDSSVPTLDTIDHLIVACYHGGKEGWNRLSRVVDVAGLLVHHPGLDFHLLNERTQRMGVGRIVKLGLYLAHELIGAPVRGPLQAPIEKPEPKMRNLARDLLKQMVYRESDPPGGAFLNQCRYLLRLHETLGARFRAVSMATATRALSPVLRRLS